MTILTQGNPVMAFPFIHKHGLVGSDSYPYIGKQKKCRRKDIKDAIATVSSWGVLEKRNEQNMENVLRHLGPLAVGINGSSKSFIHYKSGIFESKKCGTVPNHALLIVGYGEEETDNGIEKYWIARNSWGPGWGMNGYVHIKRDVKYTKEGVCGIAKNPSIAIGAALVHNKKILQKMEEKQRHSIFESSREIEKRPFVPMRIESNAFQNKTEDSSSTMDVPVQHHGQQQQ